VHATTERTTVAAVFDTRGQAEAAIDELWHMGFSHHQVGILTPGGHEVEATTRMEPAEERAASGAVTGAVAGGAVGVVAGALAAGLIPGIGPVLAGGMLTAIILGGAAGAAVGTYLGPFVALGFSEAEARHYGEALKSGRTIVTVKAGDRTPEAVAILHGHGGYDTALPVPEESSQLR
jgi:hypothetical protein